MPDIQVPENLTEMVKAMSALKIDQRYLERLLEVEAKNASDLAAAATAKYAADARIAQADARMSEAKEREASADRSVMVARGELNKLRGQLDARQRDLDARESNLTAARTNTLPEIHIKRSSGNAVISTRDLLIHVADGSLWLVSGSPAGHKLNPVLGPDLEAVANHLKRSLVTGSPR